MSIFNKKKYKHTVITNPNYRVITAEQPSSIAAESFRRVKVALEFADVDCNLQVIQVISAVQGEGKTTTLLNIAATYAEDKKKVLVVDLDFRRPKLHRSFNVENKDGISDVLAGNITLDKAIKHGNYGVDLLNRGSKVPYPTVVIGSHSMADLFTKLRTMYDVILIDCPPVLAVSDGILISRLTDGAIFVISQEKTEKAAAKEAIATLKKNQVKILGTVVTSISKKSDNYYGSKYKYYYQNYSGKKD